MVDLAHANDINVMIASVMAVGDRNVSAKGEAVIRTVVRPPAMINDLNTWLKDLCTIHRLVYFNYHATMADERGL